MKDEGQQNTDMPVKFVDTLTQRIEIEFQGKTMWMDYNEWQAMEKFMKEQEAKMWRDIAIQRQEWYGDQKCWCQEDE